MGRNKQRWQRHPSDLKFVTVSLTLVVHVQAKNCGSTNPQKSCLISLMTWTQTSLQKMTTAELASSLKMTARTVISIHPTPTSLLHPSPQTGLMLASQLKTWTEGGDVWTEKGVRECVQTDARLLQCRLNHLYPWPGLKWATCSPKGCDGDVPNTIHIAWFWFLSRVLIAAAFLYMSSSTQRELLLCMNSIDSELGFHHRSTVWLCETECHVVNMPATL